MKKKERERWREKKTLFHTQSVSKYSGRNEIIYHFSCGRVATDPFLNRLRACFILLGCCYFGITKQIFASPNPKQKKRKGRQREREKEQNRGKGVKRFIH